MEIILLGEKLFVPYYARQISSIAVRFGNYNEICLFDCGESTQHHLLRSSIKSKQIKRVFISELNADSCLGIIGLLATFNLNERLLPLEIYGPNGFCRYLRLFSRYSQTNFSYSINTISVQMGKICKFSEYKVIALPLSNRAKVFGYSILQKERIGKFRIAKARALRIPSGPLYGFLKNRIKFTLHNGCSIIGKDFSELPKKGKKFTYVARFYNRKNIIELARQSDLLLINSSEPNWEKSTLNHQLSIVKQMQELGIKNVITLGCHNISKKPFLVRVNQKKMQTLVLSGSYLSALKITANSSLERIYTQ